MTDLILHHFDISPFAEKVKVALGLKGLAWRSVQIPLVMPKPDLTALTGGYRKTPVMQIGADIYCDTRRIAIELETRFGGPELFPGGCMGQALALANWSDMTLFRPGAALSMGTNEGLPEDILSDRMAFFDFLEPEDLGERLPLSFAQFRAGLEQMERMLEDGRPWLLGESASWADCGCYTPVWMCRGNIANADELLGPLARLTAWEQRVAALGHGERSDIEADAALAEANASVSTVVPLVLADAWPRLSAGDSVTVYADDYGRDPVSGELLRLSHEEIAIGREDERAGRVTVHFPRAGYRVEAG